jgi:hypothetical protein
VNIKKLNKKVKISKEEVKISNLSENVYGLLLYYKWK